MLDFTKDLEFTDGRPAEIEVLATDMGGDRPYLLRARYVDTEDWLVFPVNERGYHLTIDGRLNVCNAREAPQVYSEEWYAHRVEHDEGFSVLWTKAPVELGRARTKVKVEFIDGIFEE